MNDQRSRRTFIGAALATLAALVARPRDALARSPGKAHPVAPGAGTVCSLPTSANVTTYSYDRSARLISITDAAN